jgi:PAS domain S-box-containing protein
MKTFSLEKILWLVFGSLITIGLILISIFSLKNGVFDIYPYFYILPIILLSYYYPKYAVYITILLGWIFLGLVYLYGPVDIKFYAASSAWFFIFVSLGVVISSFAGQIVQQKKYRGIFENTQAGVFTFDMVTLEIQEINNPAEHMLGYAHDELCSQKFSTLWFDHGQEAQFMKQLAIEKKIMDMEIPLRKKDRSVIWALVTASVTSEGFVICSVVDITANKAMKDELIESELRYRTLFDGASDAIFIHDVDGKIFETNLIASGQLGYTKREFMTMRMQDLDVRPDDLFPKERIQHLLSRGHTLFETLQKKKDGSTLPVEISSRTTEYFGMPAIMSIVRDITERKSP